MNAENVPVNDRRQRHAVEHGIARLPYAFSHFVPEPVLRENHCGCPRKNQAVTILAFVACVVRAQAVIPAGEISANPKADRAPAVPVVEEYFRVSLELKTHS